MYKVAALIVLSGAALQGAAQDWLKSVQPLITRTEEKAYLALPAQERTAFEEKFWAARSIDPEEYYRRLAYIDAEFGSSKAGSGANTDQGRIYLSLGAPVKISRIPSSRIFVPLEIWYYDAIAGYLNTELRLIFYQPNGTGIPKLYSPTTDTIRVLLLNESSTVHMFGPNDSLTENDIRQNLMVGPAEDEVITASVAVASGIKYSGNDEILGQVLSPRYMLSRARPGLVTSRLLVARPELTSLRTASFHGASQIDLHLTAEAEKEIGLEVLQGFATVYNNRVKLNFAKAEPVEYTHRLDLLPGLYRLMFTVDAKTFAYPLSVPERGSPGEIERADLGPEVAAGRRTPFEFGGRQISMNPAGRFAIVALAEPGPVTWLVREGTRIVWRGSVLGDRVAVVELPSIPPGNYKLEAVMAGDSRRTDLVIPAAATSAGKTTLVSFNANLALSRRLDSIGNQWLLRGQFTKARETLKEALEKTDIGKGEMKETQIALARVDALSGDLDGARERVRSILAANPDDFEGLSIYAYVEAKLQDYPVAAELYRRALAVQDSPALREALSKLPSQ